MILIPAYGQASGEVEDPSRFHLEGVGEGDGRESDIF